MVDLAGGEGRNAIWFASRGWQAENVEFSEVALTKFRSRACLGRLKGLQSQSRVASVSLVAGYFGAKNDVDCKSGTVWGFNSSLPLLDSRIEVVGSCPGV